MSKWVSGKSPALHDDRRSDNALCAPPSSIGNAQNGVPVANAIDGKTLLGVAALSVVLLSPSGLGVFGFDSAAFSYVAQVLQQGGVLYRDIWDNKQPGIYWFYQSVAQLIGNDWRALFIASTLWNALTAILASIALMLALPGQRAAAWIPLLVIAILATRANPEHLGQIEALVSLPLMAIGVCALRLAQLFERANDLPNNRDRQWWFEPALLGLCAGLLTGVVISFKLLLAPLAVAVFCAPIVVRIIGVEWRHVPVLATVVSYLVGAAAITAAIAVRFMLEGTFDLFWWTTIHYPLAALGAAPLAPTARLFGSIWWLTVAIMPLAPLIVVALVQGRRLFRGSVTPLTLLVLVWLAVGFVLIVAQRFSWWSYHFELLLWPLGLTAGIGAARLASWRPPVPGWWPGPRAIVAAAIVLLGVQTAFAVRNMANPNWPIRSELRQSLATAAQVQTQFARTLAGPSCGTGYVIGDPRLLVASGLRQAIATSGMSWWGAFLPAQMKRLPTQLAWTTPDYLYVSDDIREHLQQLPELSQFLSQHYRPVLTDATEGVWWQRAAPLAVTGCRRDAGFTVP